MNKYGILLLELRDNIDEIDKKIVELIQKRAALAIKLGKIKSSLNLPIHDPEREQHVLSGIASKGPLSRQATKRIFKQIIRETRMLEEDDAKGT